MYLPTFWGTFVFFFFYYYYNYYYLLYIKFFLLLLKQILQYLYLPLHLIVIIYYRSYELSYLLLFVKI